MLSTANAGMVYGNTERNEEWVQVAFLKVKVDPRSWANLQTFFIMVTVKCWLGWRCSSVFHTVKKCSSHTTAVKMKWKESFLVSYDPPIFTSHLLQQSPQLLQKFHRTTKTNKTSYFHFIIILPLSRYTLFFNNLNNRRQ